MFFNFKISGVKLDKVFRQLMIEYSEFGEFKNGYISGNYVIKDKYGVSFNNGKGGVFEITTEYGFLRNYYKIKIYANTEDGKVICLYKLSEFYRGCGRMTRIIPKEYKSFKKVVNQFIDEYCKKYDDHIKNIKNAEKNTKKELIQKHF